MAFSKIKNLFFIGVVLFLAACTGGAGLPIDAETLEGHKKKPVVASFKTEVQLDGSLAVKIFGENFKPLAKVDIKQEPCEGVEVHSALALSCTLAVAMNFGIEDIIVTNPDGLKNTPLVGNAAPTVTSVSPATGGASGGNAVTLTGTGFIGSATVKFGGSACTSPEVQDSTTLTCITPSHANGSVEVVVTNPDSKTGSLSNAFTYVSSNVWSPTSVGAAVPSERQHHTVVWTGSKMIVWGGTTPAGISLNSGSVYDPSTNTWSFTSNGANVPGPRSRHQAVWTGSKMIVWGGSVENEGYELNTGGVYDPITNTWTPMSTGLNLPIPRKNFSAVWTGSKMIVWGGFNGMHLADGGVYDPVSDTWEAVNLTGAPTGRSEHTAIWTGAEMIVWGGQGTTGVTNLGGRYHPGSKVWMPVNIGLNTPLPRSGHSAVWTGNTGNPSTSNRMIVWGGRDGGLYFNTGGIYDTLTNTWNPTSVAGDVPQAGENPVAIWTGSKMLLWAPSWGYSNWGGAI